MTDDKKLTLFISDLGNYIFKMASNTVMEKPYNYEYNNGYIAAAQDIAEFILEKQTELGIKK